MTFQVVWDWIILGLTFYTVVMVPYNLAIKRTFGNEDITLQVYHIFQSNDEPHLTSFQFPIRLWTPLLISYFLSTSFLTFTPPSWARMAQSLLKRPKSDKITSSMTLPSNKHSLYD